MSDSASHNNELPDGWKLARLPEIADINMGQSPPGHTYNDAGVGLPFFQGKADFGEWFPTARKWCSEPRKVADADDILISVRAPVGPTNIANVRCAIGRGLAAIRPRCGVPSLFVMLAFRLQEEQLAEQGTGSTFTAISRRHLDDFCLPIPPLSEQKRIVAKVEELLAHVNAVRERLEKVPAILKRFRQAVLAAACLGKLTKDWRTRHPEVGSAQDLAKRVAAEREAHWKEAVAKLPSSASRRYGAPAEITPAEPGELPETWAWTTLEALTYFTVDYRGRTPPTAESGVPVISSANIDQGRVVHEPRRCVSQSIFKEWQKRGIPDEGDLIVTTEGAVGQVALFPAGGPYVLTRRVFACKTNGIDNQFLAYCFTHGATREHIDSHSQGSTVLRILKPNLMASPVPLPPEEEQAEIVRRVEDLLSRAKAVGKVAASQLALIEPLHASLLGRAFSGELVSTEAELTRQEGRDYEPASALLERIRAEREAQAAKAAPKKRRRRRVSKT